MLHTRIYRVQWNLEKRRLPCPIQIQYTEGEKSIVSFHSLSVTTIHCMSTAYEFIGSACRKKMEPRRHVAQQENTEMMQCSTVETIQRTVRPARVSIAIADDVTAALKSPESLTGQTHRPLLMPIDKTARARFSSETATSSESTIGPVQQREQTASSHQKFWHVLPCNEQQRATTASSEDRGSGSEPHQIQTQALVHRLEGSVDKRGGLYIVGASPTATARFPETSTTSVRNATGDEQQELWSLRKQPNADADTYTHSPFRLAIVVSVIHLIVFEGSDTFSHLSLREIFSRVSHFKSAAPEVESFKLHMFLNF